MGASFAPLATRQNIASRKSVRGSAVTTKASKAKVSVSKAVVCKSENKVFEKVSVAATAAAFTMASYPEVAQAAEMTPSIKALLGSVAAGTVVLVGIVVALTTVSNFDKLDSRS